MRKIAKVCISKMRMPRANNLTGCVSIIIIITQSTHMLQVKLRTYLYCFQITNRPYELTSQTEGCPPSEAKEGHFLVHVHVCALHIHVHEPMSDLLAAERERQSVCDICIRSIVN